MDEAKKKKVLLGVAGVGLAAAAILIGTQLLGGGSAGPRLSKEQQAAADQVVQEQQQAQAKVEAEAEAAPPDPAATDGTPVRGRIHRIP